MPNPFRFARVMSAGLRQPVARTPAEVGLAYEDVAFASADGTRLKGWFVPAPEAGRQPVVVWVHGWPWNRYGNVSGRVPWQDADVDFLNATRALHDAGFGVLLFDLAAHGESEGRFPLTYGVRESADLVGAVSYLRTRSDADGDRVGVIGMSAGGSTALYGAGAAAPIRAILAIQPTKVSVFSENMARTEFGRIGPALYRSLNVLYWLLRAPLPSRHDPGVPAASLTDTVVQYVQGTGDQWGTMADVERMSAGTPRSLGVIAYPTAERYGGYAYIDTHTDDLVRFFTTYV